MNPIEINFWFADETMADALLDSVPPDGIKVSKPPAGELQAHAATSVAIYHQIYIQINVPAPIPVTLIVTWFLKTLLAKFDQGTKKTTSINDVETPLNKRQISLLVKKQLAEIHARNASQQKKHKAKFKPKKQSSPAFVCYFYFGASFLTYFGSSKALFVFR